MLRYNSYISVQQLLVVVMSTITMCCWQCCQQKHIFSDVRCSTHPPLFPSTPPSVLSMLCHTVTPVSSTCVTMLFCARCTDSVTVLQLKSSVLYVFVVCWRSWISVNDCLLLVVCSSFLLVSLPCIMCSWSWIFQVSPSLFIFVYSLSLAFVLPLSSLCIPSLCSPLSSQPFSCLSAFRQYAMRCLQYLHTFNIEPPMLQPYTDAVRVRESAFSPAH